jgi:16S rRNA (guanine527-N7)-methyltransferase
MKKNSTTPVSTNDIDKIDEYFPQFSDETRLKLRKYYDALLNFNDQLNLVSKSNLPFIAKQHFADCIQGLETIEAVTPFTKPTYDIGSGNGFPGILLALMKPELPVFLVERDGRKADFLKHLVAELMLKQCTVLAQSAESLPKEALECGVVRGLGSIANVTIQMTSAFKVGGTLFNFKGDNWTSELATCPTQVFTKWAIKSVGDYLIPEVTTSRYIISCTKIA